MKTYEIKIRETTELTVQVEDMFEKDQELYRSIGKKLSEVKQ